MPSPSTIQLNRAEINRANAQHSTGPRTESGKQRSPQNALPHGLTARSAVTPSEDPAAYQQHCRQFMDEYQPATPTETQLVQQLADTCWRKSNPARGSRCPRPRSPPPRPPAFDIVDAHRLLSNLGLHGTRLTRQFQKTLDQLRNMQLDRLEHQHRQLKEAAAILELHKYEGIPWEPSDHGFVFSKDQVERFSQRMIRQNQSHHIAYARFRMPYRPMPSGDQQPSGKP
jgi:hypothetical protein